jgi:hypothetical protein
LQASLALVSFCVVRAIWQQFGGERIRAPVRVCDGRWPPVDGDLSQVILA